MAFSKPRLRALAFAWAPSSMCASASNRAWSKCQSLEPDPGFGKCPLSLSKKLSATNWAQPIILTMCLFIHFFQVIEREIKLGLISHELRLFLTVLRCHNGLMRLAAKRRPCMPASQTRCSRVLRNSALSCESGWLAPQIIIIINTQSVQYLENCIPCRPYPLLWNFFLIAKIQIEDFILSFTWDLSNTDSIPSRIKQ